MPASLRVESRIESVVVYGRGAVVTRVAPLPALAALEGAEVDLLLQGLPPTVEPGSLRASLGSTGGPAARDVVAVDAAWTPGETPAPEDVLLRLRALAHDRMAIQDERASLAARRAALGAALEPGLARAAQREVRRGAPSFDASGRVADALAVDALYAKECAAIDERVRALAERGAEVQRRFDATHLEATQTPRGQLDGGAQPTWSVTVRLSAARSEAPLRELRVEYVVRPARWWPAHSARFTEAGTQVAWTREALVAQDSGEDWSGVALSFSTGDLVRDAALPVLKSLRIGRAQAAPRRAYRPPPTGLDALFAGFDRVAMELHASPFPAAPARRAIASGLTLGSIDAAVESLESATDALDELAVAAHEWPEGTVSKSEDAPPPAPPLGGGPPAFGAPPAPQAPPAAMMRAAPMMAPARSAGFFGPSKGTLAEAEAEEHVGVTTEPEVEPAEEWLEFNVLVIAMSVERHRRGRLTRATDRPGAPDVAQRERRIAALSSPSKAREPGDLGGVFDYRLDVAHPLDLPSDGKIHRLALDTRSAPAAAAFRVVPREAPEVYRESSFRNPHPGPLLPGPVEVFVDGALLTTSSLDQVHDAGSNVTLGLGVEERLRVARNVRVYESTAGLLGGSAQVDHAVALDVRSALNLPVRVDVLERMPVTDDKDVTVKIVSARPEGAPYDQSTRGAPIRGGVAWSLVVPAGGDAKIEWTYRITLPAKNELVGGNRRD